MGALTSFLWIVAADARGPLQLLPGQAPCTGVCRYFFTVAARMLDNLAYIWAEKMFCVRYSAKVYLLHLYLVIALILLLYFSMTSSKYLTVVICLLRPVIPSSVNYWKTLCTFFKILFVMSILVHLLSFIILLTASCSNIVTLFTVLWVKVQRSYLSHNVYITLMLAFSGAMTFDLPLR